MRCSRNRAGPRPAQDALASIGATHEVILQALTAVRGSQRVTDQNPEGKFQALEKYAKDLTELRSTLRDLAAHYRKVPGTAQRLIKTGGSGPAPRFDPAEQAAWIRPTLTVAFRAGGMSVQAAGALFLARTMTEVPGREACESDGGT